MHCISHLSLYRCVFVAGSDYRDNFLTHLVEFALKIANSGIYDYGLLEHLSDMVAGSLYMGTQGHSNLYEGREVYETAVSWLLWDEFRNAPLQKEETKSEPTNHHESIFGRYWTKKNPVGFGLAALKTTTDLNSFRVHSWTHTGKLNPYFLPWIMAKLTEDSSIRSDPVLTSELESIIQRFKTWDPKEKSLRDLKYRLEVLRSHL